MGKQLLFRNISVRIFYCLKFIQIIGYLYFFKDMVYVKKYFTVLLHYHDVGFYLVVIVKFLNLKNYNYNIYAFSSTNCRGWLVSIQNKLNLCLYGARSEYYVLKINFDVAVLYSMIYNMSFY